LFIKVFVVYEGTDNNNNNGSCIFRLLKEYEVLLSKSNGKASGKRVLSVKNGIPKLEIYIVGT